MFGLFRNVQEIFTQLKTEQGPVSIVKTWTDAPIPTYLPTDFFISDATEGDGVRFVEYVNAEKKRFSIYLYDTEGNVSLDTENADQQSQIELKGVTMYLVDKNGLSILYWSTVHNIISIEFCPEDISLDEIKAVAASMLPPADFRQNISAGKNQLDCAVQGARFVNPCRRRCFAPPAWELISAATRRLVLVDVYDL